MKKIVLGTLLFLAAHAWCASDPNPAEYTTKVHVSSSRLVVEVPNGLPLDYQVLNVVIDAKKYELKSGPVKNVLLLLGDYKAKLIQDEHKTTYDSLQVYEFLFPDNKVRKFEVVGQIE
ncbi:MAG: hypothetical protein WCD47_23730 [Candidatus Sulfotelmatobacter sp.]